MAVRMTSRSETPVVRCVNCDVQFELPGAATGSEVACTVCGESVVVGERVRGSRRMARAWDEGDVPLARRRRAGRRVFRLCGLAVLAVVVVYVAVRHGDDIVRGFDDWVDARVRETREMRAAHPRPTPDAPAAPAAPAAATPR